MKESVQYNKRSFRGWLGYSLSPVVKAAGLGRGPAATLEDGQK